jgi:hypothetical protein
VYLEGSVHPVMKTCIMFGMVWVFLRGTEFISSEGGLSLKLLFHVGCGVGKETEKKTGISLCAL